MKAFALTASDQPAHIVDLPDPEVAPDGVQIGVRAASVNGFDVFQASGGLLGMMEHALPTVVGRDFAGVVEAVGSNRSDVAVGDEVLGFIPSAPPLHDGTYSDRIITSNIVVASNPAGLSFETAAAIPLAGATALDAVQAVDVGPDDVIFIAGATGGVGSFAVQLAAQRGARVIATARPGDEEAFVRALGASDTIDYFAADVAAAVRGKFPEGVTALIDMVNRGDDFAPMAAIVRDGGRIATTLGAADVEALAQRNVRATNVVGTPTPEKLATLAEAAAAGTLQVEVQGTFPLDRADEALQAFSGGTIGKLVLVVR
ncbi:MAG TPA: NADP-dependent oxidoreductase [Candidatus Limnocylindrales bacterium]|nr:NADP-dependent oxidoreductase [Candidatus Limnocylindrales bacterium]